MCYRLSVIYLLPEKGVYPECIIVCQLSVRLLFKKGVYPECQFTLKVLPFVSYLSICCLTMVISVLFSLLLLLSD